MVMYLILLSTEVINCQMSLSLGILDSDHLSVFFHILDHVSTRDILAPDETNPDWEHFQSLAPELIYPWIHIHTIEEAEKAAIT